MVKASEFHIHVDASELHPDLETSLRVMGFTRTDFAGHPPGAQGFEPKYHLTLKVNTSPVFREAFHTTVAAARTSRGMKGYIEGEFIALDKSLPEDVYDASVEMPLKLSLGNLPRGKFRESEIHITMSRDRSHPELLQKLSEIGLFSAYLPKPTGLYQVFTAQGSRKEIAWLLPALDIYLQRAGGAADASIKEERAIKWWLSEPSIRLPPVVQSIQGLI